MNRKLLNGLLVLTVAAGGVGTFTSCKDDNFRNEVITGQMDLQQKIDAIRGITDSQFKANLEAWLNGWTSSASNGGFTSYDEMVQAANAMNQIYESILSDTLTPDAQKYVDALYKWMFGGEDIKKSDWYDMILALANKRASSVDVNQTINPVFGSIDLPIGLKTSVLASYMYEGVNSEYMFPTDPQLASHLALDFGSRMSNLQALSTIRELAAGKGVQLENGTYTMGAGFGSMGATYVNINPSSIDFSGSTNVQLVNSKDEVLLDAANGDLEVDNNSDLLSFGYTRGDQTGVYKVNANVSDNFVENGGVVVDFEEAKQFANDVKAAFKDRTISNIAYLGERLYKSVNNLLPKYSLKVWWEEPVLGVDEAGKTIINSVHSSYDLAAAVIRPLSYNTPISDGLGLAGLSDKRLPEFSPLREYLEKIGNKIKLNITHVDYVDPIDFDLTVRIEDGVVYAEDAYGQEVVVGYYDASGITADQTALNDLVNAILEGCNIELETSIQKDVIDQINDAIDAINDNLDSFNGKIGEFLQFIEDSKFYDVATRLIDIYNDFAKRVNKVLANPDHYLQVAMIYSDGEGHYHHLSTDAKDPVKVAPKDAADAIELLATSYTGDVVVPSYAKYVAITAVNGDKATVKQNEEAGSYLNTVLPGQVQRVPVKLSGFKSGDVLTITYVSVDYHGICSMRNYYVKVK